MEYKHTNNNDNFRGVSNIIEFWQGKYICYMISILNHWYLYYIYALCIVHYISPVFHTFSNISIDVFYRCHIHEILTRVFVLQHISVNANTGTYYTFFSPLMKFEVWSFLFIDVITYFQLTYMQFSTISHSIYTI